MTPCPACAAGVSADEHSRYFEWYGRPGQLCPDACGCRVATDDADASECGCGGPCQWYEAAS